MKQVRYILLLIMALGYFFRAQSQEVQSSVIFSPDTIVRVDTIVVKEEITRTDVIYRTEKVVRREERSTGSSEYSINNNSSFTDISTVRDNSLKTSANVAHGKSDNDAEYINKEMFPDPDLEGNYIWVPDSMANKVNDLLSGKSVLPFVDARKFKDINGLVDPNEKVTFRGDTIPMILKSRNLGRYDRGLFNFLFIPKGIWQIGLTASYGEFSTADLEILDLVSDIDFYGHIFSIRPYFSYFFKNNVSIGLRLGYTSGKAKIGSFNVDIDEDMSFKLHDIMYRSQNYSAALTLSQYLGIARRGRFGIFNEVELAFAGGTSDFHRPYNSLMRETHTSIYEVGLNFSPGLCVYVLDQLSFNVSFGVFGLNIKHEKQDVNGEPLGERTTSGANFRFNIFNINFGIAVNI